MSGGPVDGSRPRHGLFKGRMMVIGADGYPSPMDHRIKMTGTVAGGYSVGKWSGSLQFEIGRRCHAWGLQVTSSRAHPVRTVTIDSLDGF